MSGKTIAIALAGVAVVLAGVAVIVVATRPHEVAMPALSDARVVAAKDIVALASDPQTRFITQGAHVDNAELAARLGLVPDDAIIALSGVPILQANDIQRVITMNGAEIFAEIVHAGSTTLVRWKLTGSLRAARYEARAQTQGSASLALIPSLPPPPRVSPINDALLDTIVRVDDTHFTVPRATVDAVFADPMKLATSVRMVPSTVNGVPDGLRLFGIRPSSILGRVGMVSGDTLRLINGMDVSNPSAALDTYTKLRHAMQLELSIERRGQPMSIVITVN